jgi:tRNA1Val (adenine37-N6)-methyltransferase
MAFSSAQTFDPILGGTLTIVQPCTGYRFAIDSILLARFAHPRPGARVLELGAGCGVVAVMLAALHHPSEVVAMELQPQLSAMITRNAVLNGIATVTAVCADLRQQIVPGVTPAAFHYIVANPPYRAERSGRESPNASRRIARGAGGATLDDFVTAAARYASHGAKIAVVFTAARTAELIAGMKRHSLEPKRVRFVHPLPGKPATMVLLEARKGGGVEATIEPPLFLYAEPGVYSGEARALLEGPG